MIGPIKPIKVWLDTWNPVGRLYVEPIDAFDDADPATGLVTATLFVTDEPEAVPIGFAVLDESGNLNAHFVGSRRDCDRWLKDKHGSRIVRVSVSALTI